MLRVAAATLVSLGMVVMLGWAFGIALLTSVLPGLATMKPNTALCFIVTGVAIWLFSTTGSRARVLAPALGGAVAAIAALTVLEYRMQWDGGFDALLFSEGGVAGDEPYPMRMSEMTAVAFFLSGTALALVPAKSLSRWVHACAVGVGAISLTALVGYVYGVSALYGVDPFSSLALHTALGFAVTVVAVLHLRPEGGLAAILRSATAGGSTARGLLPAALAVPFLLGWLVLVGVRGDAYEHEFGVALLAVASMLTFVALIWGYASWLDRAESLRTELEAQLLRSQKMSAVARLAGGVAHDFNNVLSVVLTTAELARDEATDERQREDLTTIRDAATRASALTKQLLALGRKQVLRPRIVSMNQVLLENDAIVRRLVPENITLRVRPGEGLHNVRVDPSQLEQVILNLVINAVDAMPSGGNLTIETRDVSLDLTYTRHHAEVEPGAYVALVVADTGVGMSPDVVERVFEPFFTTKGKEGTGLGLSTVYGVARQSGGHVWVYSEPGHGTTFKIYLPMVRGPTDSLAIPARAAPSRGGGEAILVVDDNEPVRKAAETVLRRGGYVVRTATGGKDALRLVEEQQVRFDLILCDVMMPGMGARELTEHLVAVDAAPRMLYMSGYADDSGLLEGLVEEGHEMVEKPFTPSDLLDAVRTALDRVPSD